MYRRIINSHPAFQLEWDFQILNEFLVYSEIEIIEISAPVSGGRYNPVNPAFVLLSLLAIIKEIVGELFDNLIFMSEHEKTGRCWMKLSIITASQSSKLIEEVTVIQFFPNMAWSQRRHSVTVASDTVCIKDTRLHLFENEQILAFCCSITQHRGNLFPGTFIISLAVSSVTSGERISIKENGFIIPLSPRDSNCYDAAPVCFYYFYILLRENIDTDFFWVIDGVPELFYQQFRVWEIYRVKTFILIFLDTKQNDTAKRISKC